MMQTNSKKQLMGQNVLSIMLTLGAGLLCFLLVQASGLRSPVLVLIVGCTVTDLGALA